MTYCNSDAISAWQLFIVCSLLQIHNGVTGTAGKIRGQLVPKINNNQGRIQKEDNKQEEWKMNWGRWIQAEGRAVFWNSYRPSNIILLLFKKLLGMSVWMFSWTLSLFFSYYYQFSEFGTSSSSFTPYEEQNLHGLRWPCHSCPSSAYPCQIQVDLIYQSHQVWARNWAPSEDTHMCSSFMTYICIRPSPRKQQVIEENNGFSYSWLEQEFELSICPQQAL